MNVATNHNYTAEVLAQIARDRAGLEYQLQELDEHEARVIRRNRESVAKQLARLDPNRPATLYLEDERRLHGYVTFGSIAGFVHVPGEHSTAPAVRFGFTEVRRITQ